LLRGHGEEWERSEPRCCSEEDQAEPEATRVEDRDRQQYEGEQLDRRAQRDLRRRFELAPSLAREEGEDHQGRDQRVALPVLHREQDLEVEQGEGQRGRALGEEAVERVPEQERVEQAPAEERQREREVRQRREQQRERRAVLVVVEMLLG